MNYEELGFKCGIEIHQQLATRHKLFCHCPVDMQDEHADVRISRYLRAVKGESGAEDEAAKREAEKSRKMVYKYYRRNNCLVELDEEPPHPMNQEALDTALIFARMVDADIPDEIQVMRKIVVDGSNTSGFQRTSMIGLDGELETSEGIVTIDDIELEEESAGVHERNENKAVYDLNRLGIPLIEVGTDASIKNAEHAREVAMKIGMLLRSTRKARRGLGTIRQDVNVSIADGARVEIKGFQDVNNIDELIELEVKRQKNLVELGKKLDSEKEVVGDNVTHIFENSGNDIIDTVLENDGAVYCIKIPSLDGKMKEKISGERYVAKELVDYAKHAGIQGIIHTDENISGYQLREEFDELEEIFDRTEDDVLAVVAGPSEQVRNAARNVKQRAEMLLKGKIPEETRAAEQDFTTSYSRPLPGAARMYPETDIPAIRISEDKVKEVDEHLPATLEETEERISEDIGGELASQIVSSQRLVLYEELEDEFERKIVANILVNVIPKLEADGIAVENISQNDIEKVLESLENGEMKKGDIEPVFERISGGETVEKAIEKHLGSKSSEEDIRNAVKEVLEEKSEMIEEQGMRAQGPLMGILQQKVDADGATIAQILQEELEKVS